MPQSLGLAEKQTSTLQQKQKFAWLCVRAFQTSHMTAMRPTRVVLHRTSRSCGSETLNGFNGEGAHHCLKPSMRMAKPNTTALLRLPWSQQRGRGLSQKPCLAFSCGCRTSLVQSLLNGAETVATPFQEPRTFSANQTSARLCALRIRQLFLALTIFILVRPRQQHAVCWLIASLSQTMFEKLMRSCDCNMGRRECARGHAIAIPTIISRSMQS